MKSGGKQNLVTLPSGLITRLSWGLCTSLKTCQCLMRRLKFRILSVMEVGIGTSCKNPSQNFSKCGRIP